MYAPCCIDVYANGTRLDGKGGEDERELGEIRQLLGRVAKVNSLGVKMRCPISVLLADIGHFWHRVEW